MAEMKTLSYEFSKVMASRLEEKDAQVQAMEKLAGEIREEEEEDDLPPRGFVDPRARFPNRAPGETFPPRKKEEPEPDEPPLNPDEVEIRFEDYYDEDKQIQVIMDLVDNELSEPYNIFTYRYFVNNWPKLTFLAWHGDKCVGVIICKLDHHKKGNYRGYIAMLVVVKRYRKLGLGRELVRRCLAVMQRERAHECVLEVEHNNEGALRLYDSLGFIRDKRLEKYYLTGNDAFRMKLRFKQPCDWREETEPTDDDGLYRMGLEFLQREREKTQTEMDALAGLTDAMKATQVDVDWPDDDDVPDGDVTEGLRLWPDGKLSTQYPGKYEEA